MKTIVALLGLFALQDSVSPDLLEYQPTVQVKGALEFGPAEGFERILNRWGDRMKQFHPDLRGARVGKATGTLPEALTAGTARFGILGRRWTDGEVECFRGQWGFFPTWLWIGGDALSIVVHPDNPISVLSLEQLDSIFSSARRRGGKPLVAWGDTGLQDEECRKLPIRGYVPAKPSRARTAFQGRVLQGSSFRDGMKEVETSDDLLRAVAEDPCAIGFVGGLVRAAGVRVVPLIASAGARGVEPNSESVTSLAYPLSWRVYVAVRKFPGSPVDSDIAEFLRLVLSRDGQEIFADEGLVPVTGRFARKELLKLK